MVAKQRIRGDPWPAGSDYHDAWHDEYDDGSDTKATEAEDAHNVATDGA